MLPLQGFSREKCVFVAGPKSMARSFRAVGKGTERGGRVNDWFPGFLSQRP